MILRGSRDRAERSDEAKRRQAPYRNCAANFHISSSTNLHWPPLTPLAVTELPRQRDRDTDMRWAIASHSSAESSTSLHSKSIEAVASKLTPRRLYSTVAPTGSVRCIVRDRLAP